MAWLQLGEGGLYPGTMLVAGQVSKCAGLTQVRFLPCVVSSEQKSRRQFVQTPTPCDPECLLPNDFSCTRAKYQNPISSLAHKIRVGRYVRGVPLR